MLSLRLLVHKALKGFKMQKQTYNKSDILRRVSYKINMSNEELKIILDCFINVISDMFKESKDRIHLEIRNFGSFDIVPTNTRKNARNPKTKKQIIIPPRKKITFKPAKQIKEVIYKSRIIE